MSLDLDPIRERLNAATPGPWHVFGTLAAWEDETDLGVGPDDAPPVAEGLDHVDADLIANAPTDIAALLAEVDRLRNAFDRVDERLEATEEVAKVMGIRAVIRVSSIRDALEGVRNEPRT